MLEPYFHIKKFILIFVLVFSVIQQGLATTSKDDPFGFNSTKGNGYGYVQEDDLSDSSKTIFPVHTAGEDSNIVIEDLQESDPLDQQNLNKLQKAVYDAAFSTQYPIEGKVLVALGGGAFLGLAAGQQSSAIFFITTPLPLPYPGTAVTYALMVTCLATETLAGLPAIVNFFGSSATKGLGLWRNLDQIPANLLEKIKSIPENKWSSAEKSIKYLGFAGAMTAYLITEYYIIEAVYQAGKPVDKVYHFEEWSAVMAISSFVGRALMLGHTAVPNLGRPLWMSPEEKMHSQKLHAIDHYEYQTLLRLSEKSDDEIILTYYLLRPDGTKAQLLKDTQLPQITQALSSIKRLRSLYPSDLQDNTQPSYFNYCCWVFDNLNNLLSIPGWSLILHHVLTESLGAHPYASWFAAVPGAIELSYLTSGVFEKFGNTVASSFTPDSKVWWLPRAFAGVAGYTASAYFGTGISWYGLHEVFHNYTDTYWAQLLFATTTGIRFAGVSGNFACTNFQRALNGLIKFADRTGKYREWCCGKPYEPTIASLRLEIEQCIKRGLRKLRKSKPDEIDQFFQDLKSIPLPDIGTSTGVGDGQMQDTVQIIVDSNRI